MEENKTTELGDVVAASLHPVLLLREIATKFLAVILVAVIAMSCAYTVTLLAYKPQYETKTTFVVSIRNGAPSVYSNLNAAQELASSFSQVLSSDVMRKQIANELGVKSISGNIEATIVDETNILELRVSASNPRDAYLITEALLNCYEPLVTKVLNNVVLDILQYPTIPTAPVNPLSVRHPMKIAGLAAAAATIALLCVFAYLRDTVKSADEVENKLDTKVIGTVQHEKKYKTIKDKLIHKKTSILLTNPTTGFDFVETFRKLRTRIDYIMRKNNQKVLMVTSVMENEGKSTVATNIALAMKKKYDKVLLIEGDMKKPALHKILEYKQEDYSSINDLLEGKAELKDALVTDPVTGIHLLLGRKGIEHSTELVSSRRMRALIHEAKKTMDMVIIDTPPMSACPDTECIAEFADACVLVVHQDQAPVKVINDMIDELNASHASLLGCILNDFRSADIDDNFSYGRRRYGKYGYGKYGYGKYGYGKYGYGKYGYGHKQEKETEEET